MIELFETPEGDKHTKHFLPRELRCRCEHCKMQKPHGYTDAQLIKIEKLRLAIGRAYTPNSAYRCPQHPIEAAKANPVKDLTLCTVQRISHATELNSVVRW